MEQGFFQTDCFIWLWEHFEETKCIHQDFLSALVISKQPCKLFIECLLEDMYALKAQHCIRMFLRRDHHCPHSEFSAIRFCPQDPVLTASALGQGGVCGLVVMLRKIWTDASLGINNTNNSWHCFQQYGLAEKPRVGSKCLWS